MAKRAANGRSSIYQGGDGRCHGRVSMGTGPDGREGRRHVTGKSQGAGAKKVRRPEKARDAGVVAATGRTTVAEYLEEWISRKERPRSVRPLTLHGYRTDRPGGADLPAGPWENNHEQRGMIVVETREPVEAARVLRHQGGPGHLPGPTPRAPTGRPRPDLRTAVNGCSGGISRVTLRWS